MSLIITRGLGPSAGLAGRDGLITQGYGAPANTVPQPAEIPAYPTDWKWIEFARLRNIQGIDPAGISSVRTVELSMSSLGERPEVHIEEGSQSSKPRSVPVVRANAGNIAMNKLRAFKRRR